MEEGTAYKRTDDCGHEYCPIIFVGIVGTRVRMNNVIVLLTL